MPNGNRLPTDFNEGAKNDTYSHNQKMIGYSFDHEFYDTFIVRQNLRFAGNKTSQNSVYGYGVCTDPATSGSKQYFTVDVQLQSTFATGVVGMALMPTRVGLLLTFIGAPYFIYLLRKQSR